MTDFTLKYMAKDNNEVKLTASSGNITFLVGANGTGKSTLMQGFAEQNKNICKRIIAQRQIWFHSNTIDLTPQNRVNTEVNIKNVDAQAVSRYQDTYGAQKAQVAIYDLIDAENVEARLIANALRNGDDLEAKKLASRKSPLSILNDILKMSNLDISINVEKNSSLTAVRNGSDPYSIAELSDGERNALLIIADVLTAPENILFLIDEPERHLHRSIVSPLLNTLLAYRDDCAFVISTHDISLPIDQEKCSALLVRSYSHNPKYWNIDYLDKVESLDEEIALAVLGSRKVLLFIEGDNSSSLDLQIYQLLRL